MAPFPELHLTKYVDVGLNGLGTFQDSAKNMVEYNGANAHWIYCKNRPSSIYACAVVLFDGLGAKFVL